jgi:hypothetical protein
MGLRDPIPAYNASNNAEAQLLAVMLNDAGVAAFAIDDVSQVGYWMFGVLPEIHKPQVWIERDSIDRAKPILEEYERQLAERREKERNAASDEPIDVICEECGEHSQFPGSQNGTTQNCPHCGAYVDVGQPVEIEGWNESPSED